MYWSNVPPPHAPPAIGPANIGSATISRKRSLSISLSIHADSYHDCTPVLPVGGTCLEKATNPAQSRLIHDKNGCAVSYYTSDSNSAVWRDDWERPGCPRFNSY